MTTQIEFKRLELENRYNNKVREFNEHIKLFPKKDKFYYFLLAEKNSAESELKGFNLGVEMTKQEENEE